MADGQQRIARRAAGYIKLPVAGVQVAIMVEVHVVPTTAHFFVDFLLGDLAVFVRIVLLQRFGKRQGDAG